MKQQFLTTNKQLLLRVPGGSDDELPPPRKTNECRPTPKKGRLHFKTNRGHPLVFREVLFCEEFFEILRSRLVGKCWKSTTFDQVDTIKGDSKDSQ